MPPSRDDDGPRVLRVAELNRIARLALEHGFPDVWVEGELSDVTRPASGHVYFVLNDGERAAQARGVMFRSDAVRSKARLENGVRVRLRAALTLFEPRGTFQIQARIALPAGEGDLHAEIARVRQKLASEGLLDPARKRALPRYPRTIGVVTSRDGAALHDVVRVATGRMPVRLVLAHCQVQGPGAAESIVAALASVQRLRWLDAVIVARGGGGSDDLMAFNDERVARAVAACRVPVVAGVGHEVDVTLTDLVADVRAATPSNAAELLVPEEARVRADIDAQVRRLSRALEVRIERERMALERMALRVTDPRRGLAAPRARLGALAARLERALRRRIAEGRARVARASTEVSRHEPRALLVRDRAALEALEGRARRAMAERLGEASQRLAREREALEREGRAAGPAGRRALGMLVARLEALSPLAVLSRGYAIALADGRAVTDASELAKGDALRVRLARGAVSARVEEVEEE